MDKNNTSDKREALIMLLLILLIWFLVGVLVFMSFDEPKESELNKDLSIEFGQHINNQLEQTSLVSDKSCNVNTDNIKEYETVILSDKPLGLRFSTAIYTDSYGQSYRLFFGSYGLASVVPIYSTK